MKEQTLVGHVDGIEIFVRSWRPQGAARALLADLLAWVEARVAQAPVATA